MQLYWTPQPATPGAPASTPGTTAPTPRSRLAVSLAFSATVHVAVAVLGPSLSFGPGAAAPDEQMLVRTIDFVEPQMRSGDRRPAGDAAGSPTAAATAPAARVARAPRPAPRPSPAPAQTATASEAPVPSPAQAPLATEGAAPETATPAPSPEDARLAAAIPRSVGGASGGSAGGPAVVVAPAREPARPAGGAATVIGPAVAGGDGPVATVALPPALVRGNGAAGSGSGAGSGAGGASGTGTGGVDTGDPDFSEYFRLIERRVRAAWQFPESLGGTTQTVKIGFALAPEGSLRDVRVVSSSSGTLNDSALSAMRKAAPFPPLPTKFRALAGQPLVMSFTVTIR